MCLDANNRPRLMTQSTQHDRVHLRNGGWLMAAENRPGAIAVTTPTNPGHVTLKYVPAFPLNFATTTVSPSPSMGQSNVRNMRFPVPDGSGPAPVVQVHSYDRFKSQAPDRPASTATSAISS